MSLTVRFLNYLSRRRPITIWMILTACLALVGYTDYLTGTHVTITFFYLIPIAIAAWVLGQKAGWLVAALSTLVLQLALGAAGDTASTPIILWNAIARLAVFLVVANLIAEFRRLLKHQTELSRTDPLTDILNWRAFHEAANGELKGMQQVQKPLTFAFIDIDDFKSINDSLGHAAGDRVLIAVATCLRSQLWGTDVEVRLGGDEFGILMPHTDAVAARKVILRLQKSLLDEMAKQNWPVTFSIGVVTCNHPPADLDQLVQLGDQAMYAAKRGGKNRIEYHLYPAGPASIGERAEEPADERVAESL